MTTITTTDHELSKDELAAVTGGGITEYGAINAFVAVLIDLVFTK